MIRWLYDFGLSPEENVHKDFSLFESFDGLDVPFLVRVHTFSHYCATLGYLSPLNDFTLPLSTNEGISLLRRVSGGSIAFHGEDLCLSFFLRTKVSPVCVYHSCVTKIRSIITTVIEKGSGISLSEGKPADHSNARGGYCIESGDKFDVFLEGIKFAGFAGRVRRNRLLIHLQINSSGWKPAVLNHLLERGHTVPDGHSTVKKFVFSESFLENIKDEIQREFSAFLFQEGSYSECLTG
ncbi:MAG: hypothetical protein GTN70_03025 [Deltaproteobacteria bacterium]|nr:hypothetical protein [Deltaproteobacteria bacterium]NIS76619.1 hypothetical protein [Deltaproteobacteria bacterium]